MSLITRCTTCGTLFKVVADQLKISDGWVRCGQCATVFDAQSNLVQVPVSEQTFAQHQTTNLPPSPVFQSAPVQAELMQLAPGTIKPESQLDAANGIGSEIESFRNSKFQGSGMLGEYVMPVVAKTQTQTQPQPKPIGKITSGSIQDDAQTEAEAADYSDSQNILIESAEPTTFFPISAMDKSQWLDSMGEPVDAKDTQGADAATAPSFVVQAQRQQRWRSPWVRLGLGLLCVGLLAMLAAQIAVHDKNYIAARWPHTKTWLDRVCQPFDCQVQALKRIEAIAIDASSFNRINKNNALPESITQSYRLGVTLKNTGALPVAMPHVELTLQDAQDQSILRRVLSPADLGLSLQAVGPSQDMAGNLTLQVDTTQLAGGRIAGYRVLAFYP